MALVRKLKQRAGFPSLAPRFKYQRIRNYVGFFSYYQERIKPRWLNLKNSLVSHEN